MSKNSINKLVQMGLLTALSIILTRVFSIQVSDSIRISFGSLPIILAGIWLGPVSGLVVGGASDFLGAVLFSGLGFNPPLMIGPMLVGLTAGLVAKFIMRNGSILQITIVCASAFLVGNVLYMTAALSVLYHMSFPVMLIGRLPVQIGTCLAEIAMVYVLHSRVWKRVLAHDV